MKRRWIVCLLIGCIITTPVLAGQKMETLYSRGNILIDKESKRILYERHGKDKMPMASTTKIMTCILALEQGKLDDVVTASARASKAPKVKLGLKVDEKQRLGDLLYSLMMESHNDTAVAIAEHIGGSVEAFCAMMTEKAHALGAVNTCFETPNGLDSENHYATPYDMALITAYALDNPQFLEIISTLDKQIPTEPLEGSATHQLVNKNRFIREYTGALGVKTGYTSKAGHCFVGASQRNDMTLIGVALGAGCDKAAKTRKYTDVKKMMNYGYANYHPYQITEQDTSAGEIAVVDGKVPSVTAIYKETLVLPLNEAEKTSVQIKVNLPQVLSAPVEAGTVIGDAQVVCGNQVLTTTQLVAKEAIAKQTFIDKIKKFFKAD